MALPHVGSVQGAAITRGVEPQQKFGKVLEKKLSPTPQPGVSGEVAPKPVIPARADRVAAGQVTAGERVGQAAKPSTAVRVVDQLTAAQQRLDRILAMAESGRSFTPAELIGMQARVSQASQQLDLAGKVVDKATSGVKQILQTQV
jgi:hypothetical protein